MSCWCPATTSENSSKRSHPTARGSTRKHRMLVTNTRNSGTPALPTLIPNPPLLSSGGKIGTATENFSTAATTDDCLISTFLSQLLGSTISPEGNVIWSQPPLESQIAARPLAADPSDRRPISSDPALHMGLHATAATLWRWITALCIHRQER